MLTVLSLAGLLAARFTRHERARSPIRYRAAIHLVAVAWVIELTRIVGRLTVRPIEEWGYWISGAVALVGIAWAAALLARRTLPSAWLSRAHLAAIACAMPLAFDWPLGRALTWLIPRVL